MTPQGAAVLLEDRARVILIQTASQNKTALDCLHRAFAVKAVDSQSAALLSSLHDTMSRLVETFNHASDPSAHFSCAHGLITLIPKELQDPPSWLGDIARILRDSAATHSEDPERTREECTFLTVALVRTYPLHFPSILFDSQDRAGAEGQKPKPLSWHFAQLRVIDIRATLSSMCDKTAAPAYQSVLNRLTASYEILSAFIAFLVQKSSTAVPFSFDVILQLRDEMSKLCSETMDFLCGRYDGALNTEMNNPDFALKKSKASGRPSSRSDSMPLPTTAMANHPLVVAQIRMLAFWLEEDSSSVKLRDEAGSIMDVLLKLYNTNGELRPPILMIVEQTLGIKNGVDLFCHNNGWEVLMRDLEATLFAPPSYSAAPSSSSSPPERVLEERLDDDAIARAMQIVAILGPVANDGLVGGTSYAQWLELVTLAVRLHDCDGKDKGKAKTKKTEAKTKTDVKGKGKAKTEDKTKGKTDDKGTGKAKGGEAFRHFKQVVMSQAVELARKAKELGVGGGMDEVVGRLVDVTAEAVESLGVS
ncbi:MAG: hypothetical protein LQ352_005553 [Teloschistes flavicans]|nr:MAG: hypothetical protein LQ352_005553 [Teloschistes flavicans]